MSAHAQIPRIQIVESICSNIHLLSQTHKTFTSVSPLSPALFTQSVTKKPHIPLNASAPPPAKTFLCGN
jgi:hypothetical protein